MSKYYLVASYYNQRNNTYENETIIEVLDNQELNSLYNIDIFTSSHTKTEILKLIEKEKNKYGLNHLVIKYYKNKTSTPEHFRPIINNQDFRDCIPNSDEKEKEIYIQGKLRKTRYINPNNKLYKEELTKLLKLLATNYENFKTIYPSNNVLSSLVNSYFQSSYDNSEEEQRKKKEIEKDILLEFSRYKTFRYWYINQLKIKNNNLSSSKNASKSSVKPILTVPKIEVKTIEEHEREYEEKFTSLNGKTYYEYNTNKYNEEHEEFLSEDEYKNMNEEYENKSLRRH